MAIRKANADAAMSVAETGTIGTTTARLDIIRSGAIETRGESSATATANRAASSVGAIGTHIVNNATATDAHGVGTMMTTEAADIETTGAAAMIDA